MLDKKHRLPSSVSFKNSKTFSGSAFFLKILKGQGEFPRFGVVVGKKIDKRAVGRNKIKRQIRSSIEKLIPKMQEPSEVLIIARAGIREMGGDEIADLLKESFKKNKLI